MQMVEKKVGLHNPLTNDSTEPIIRKPSRHENMPVKTFALKKSLL